MTPMPSAHTRALPRHLRSTTNHSRALPCRSTPRHRPPAQTGYGQRLLQGALLYLCAYSAMAQPASLRAARHSDLNHPSAPLEHNRTVNTQPLPASGNPLFGAFARHPHHGLLGTDQHQANSTRQRRAKLLMPNEPPPRPELLVNDDAQPRQAAHKGDDLLRYAEQVRNPVASLLPDNPGRCEQISAGIADGVITVVTLGMNKAIAIGLDHQGHLQNGNLEGARQAVSEERFSEWVGALGPPKSGSFPIGRPLPRLLRPPVNRLHQHFADSALRSTDPASGISQEAWLLGQYRGQRVVLEHRQANQYVMHDLDRPLTAPSPIKPLSAPNTWRVPGEKTDVLIEFSYVPGRRSVPVQGYAVDVVVSPRDQSLTADLSAIHGKTVYEPIYREKISNTYHPAMEHQRPAFGAVRAALIQRLKVEYDPRDARYIETELAATSTQTPPRVYDVQPFDTSAESYRVVEINAELVPVRQQARFGAHPGPYEVYNRQNPALPGHGIQWDGWRWRFEPASSPYLSAQLRKAITPEMLNRRILTADLSAEDSQGIMSHRSGSRFIKAQHGFVEVYTGYAEQFLVKGPERLVLVYQRQQLHIARYERYDGRLPLSPAERAMQATLEKPGGLLMKKAIHLNNQWKLSSVGLKAEPYIDSNTVGSRVSVTLNLNYIADGTPFIDTPALTWHENIKTSDLTRDRHWQFDTDLYRHQPRSQTFFVWRNRYQEAFHYARSRDKARFRGNVKLLTRLGLPAESRFFQATDDPVEQARQVKKYLQRHGGQLRVTVVDLPQMRLINAARERVVRFDVGFENHPNLVHFNQVIYLDAQNRGQAFVTLSDAIRAAQWANNAEPPPGVISLGNQDLHPGEHMG